MALTWQDVDWLARSLRMDKSLEQTRQGLRLKRPKNGRARVFRIPQSAMTALEFHRTQQQEAKRLFGPDYHDTGLIFCTPNGDFLKPDIVSQTIVRRLRKAGIKDASLHSMRHTHGSHLLSRGVPLPAVSARLDTQTPTSPRKFTATPCQPTMTAPQMLGTPWLTSPTGSTDG